MGQSSPDRDRAVPPPDPAVAPVATAGTPRACEAYAPGHQMHHRHQGDAVRSPSRTVRQVLVDGTRLTLTLDDGHTLHWRHHDPERMGRLLELLRGRSVVYPEFHALRVGPYWFNCSPEQDWHECGPSPVGRAAAR